MGDGKCGFLEVRALRKSWRAKVRVRVRALTVMDLALMSQPGFPVVKWPREAKIRVKVRALTVMDLALRRRCVLHRGRSAAEVTPLSTPISLLIDRNYTITFWFYDLVISWLLYIRSIWYLMVNYLTNKGAVGGINLHWCLDEGDQNQNELPVLWHAFWACCLGVSGLIRSH